MATMAAVAALIGAGTGALAAPYLARLSRTALAPTGWWRGAPAGRRRRAATVLIAVAFGALAGAAAGLTQVLPAFVFLALTGTPLAIVDLTQHRLPNRLVALAGAGGAVLLAVGAALGDDWHRLGRAGAAAVVVFTIFAAFAALTRGVGMGDAKLSGVLAGYLGWFGWVHVCYGVFAGFVAGALVAFVLVAARRISVRSSIAFGPLLMLGALAVPALDLLPGGVA